MSRSSLNAVLHSNVFDQAWMSASLSDATLAATLILRRTSLRSRVGTACSGAATCATRSRSQGRGALAVRCTPGARAHMIRSFSSGRTATPSWPRGLSHPTTHKVRAGASYSLERADPEGARWSQGCRPLAAGSTVESRAVVPRAAGGHSVRRGNMARPASPRLHIGVHFASPAQR
jgi:hypothetical protein